MREKCGCWDNAVKVSMVIVLDGKLHSGYLE